MEYIASMDYSVQDGKQRTTNTETVGQFEQLRVLCCIKGGTTSESDENSHIHAVLDLRFQFGRADSRGGVVKYGLGW